MLATIIISSILVLIVSFIIYRMIRSAKSGKGQCAGCAYAGTCAAVKYSKNKSDCELSEPAS
ncbi:MAG: FeoB-associated Cys-rich membrane protein [Chloroflexi bacterium]|nr:FeoB-associated Cys-rich membrane protein [Chloroflexota bacterium]